MRKIVYRSTVVIYRKMNFNFGKVRQRNPNAKVIKREAVKQVKVDEAKRVKDIEDAIRKDKVSTNLEVVVLVVSVVSKSYSTVNSNKLIEKILHRD